MGEFELSQEQKIALVGGKNFWETVDIPEAGIPSIMLTDGPHGLRKQAGEADHLGLNASVPATCFPPAVTLASTWDPELLRRIGEALGRECRREDVQVLLGPGINIKRSPLCGRNFEYFSEDPYLAGALAEKFVQGLQEQGVGSSLKHFAVNSQETDRLQVSAEVDERTLREIYLKAFERVVRKAHPWTVMCSYNSVNGVPASQNKWLLTDVLREQWGYEGVVVSDWGAVIDRVAALEAGLDLEMPSSNGAGSEELREALASGALSEDVLDVAVARMLNLVEKGNVSSDAVAVDFESHNALAEEAAAAGMVLLKNEGALPLADSSVCLIGELARTPRYQGAGSSQVNPTKLSSLLDAFGVEDTPFAAGYRLDGREDEELIRDAVEVARNRTAVIVMGLPAEYESEGFDRTTIDLPQNQLELLRAVSGVAASVVVVLANGSAVDVASWEEHADAVLEAWLTGQAGGTAIKKVLFGELEPTGRLAETIPLKLSDNPAHLNWPGENHRVLYGEEIFVGYRGYDRAQREVAYPFGFGLGYASFEYANATATVVLDPTREPMVASPDDFAPVVEVAVDVSNSSDRDGVEVVQVYARFPESKFRREVRSLVGFRRVSVPARSTVRVVIPVEQHSLCVWDEGWCLEGGRYVFDVGRSSRDVRVSAEVVLRDHDYHRDVTAESTFRQWSENPAAREVIASVVGEGVFSALEGNLLTLAGDQPISRLTRVVGDALTMANVEEAVAIAASRAIKEV